MPDVTEFLSDVVAWARDSDDVLAVALVGSQARGAARADSDVDLVILLGDRQRYLEDAGWTGQFGTALSLAREDSGAVQSLRVRYADGLEVEFGLASGEWAATEPVDEGTRRVAADGLRILFDPHGRLARLMAAIAR